MVHSRGSFLIVRNSINKFWLSECFHTSVGEGYLVASKKLSFLKNGLYTGGMFWDESHYGKEKGYGCTKFLQC